MKCEQFQVMLNAIVLAGGVLMLGFVNGLWAYVYLFFTMLYIILSVILQKKGYFFDERKQHSNARTILLWVILGCLFLVWYGNQMGYDVQPILAIVYALFFAVNLLQYRVYQKNSVK